MRKICLLIAAIAVVQVVIAQDVIVTKQSEQIDAKILSVTDREIEYKIYNYPDGPTITISTSEILTITYQSGDVQTFNTKGKNTKEKNLYKSTISWGISMPSLIIYYEGTDEWGYSTGHQRQDIKLYGGYIGYAARISTNNIFSFRPGMLVNFTSNFDNEHMLDIRMPLLVEVGVTFDNDMRIYACFGDQLLLGLSYGDYLFEYKDYLKRHDLGLFVGGGFNFASFMGVEVQYTFGLLNRGLIDHINFLSIGFNLYL